MAGIHDGKKESSNGSVWDEIGNPVTVNPKIVLPIEVPQHSITYQDPRTGETETHPSTPTIRPGPSAGRPMRLGDVELSPLSTTDPIWGEMDPGTLVPPQFTGRLSAPERFAEWVGESVGNLFDSPSRPSDPAIHLELGNFRISREVAGGPLGKGPVAERLARGPAMRLTQCAP